MPENVFLKADQENTQHLQPQNLYNLPLPHPLRPVFVAQISASHRRRMSPSIVLEMVICVDNTLFKRSDGRQWTIHEGKTSISERHLPKKRWKKIVWLVQDYGTRQGSQITQKQNCRASILM
jgi:hypothetical protein